MEKSSIVAAILENLRDVFDARRSVSKRTRATGNDIESRAENKYDTLSIEQNYLADGLAKQAHEAAVCASAYETLELRNFGPADEIDLGALVEMTFPDGSEWFFLGPTGGGVEVSIDGITITVITPESPLGAELIGRKSGEATSMPAARILRVC